MFRAVLLLLLSVVTGGAASAVDEDDPAWSACWTSFKPPACEAEDVDVPKGVYSFLEEKWSVCSVKRPEFRHSLGVMGYARGWAQISFRQIPTLPDFVQVLDLSSFQQLELWNETFANVPYITGLVMENTNLRGVQDSSFPMLKNLTCLNLDNNPKLGAAYRSGFFYTVYLKQILLLPSLKRLSARNCNLLSDRVSRDWQYPNNVNLLSLWLSGNVMSPTLRLQSFVGFIVLRELDLSNCLFKVLDPYIYLPKYCHTHLQMLNLSNNLITSFPWTPSIDEQCECGLTRFPNLTILDLSHNKIEDFDINTFGNKFPRKQQLSHKRLVVIYTQYLLPASGFPALRHLNLSHNMLHVISAHPILPSNGFAALRHLDLSSQNNPTVDVEATIFQIPSLLSLNLENRRLTFNTPPVNASRDVEFSKTHSELRELYVSGDALRQFNEQKLLDLLGHLHDLETLSLANSRLDFVSATVFSNFPKLRVLNLRDNAINVIPEGCFDPLTVLSRLDLSNNKITVISHRTFGEGLRARLDVVDLGQNPIVCSCDLLWFRDWFMADSKLFSVSDPDYQCHDTPAKTQLADFTMHQQACLLSREVNEGIIFICSFLTITSTAAVLLFRYRWHLRLVFYEAFRGQGDVRKWRLQHGRFEHDVFVSYAREDFHWIRHRLMPQLEDRLHLRLCIHDRQFIPGKNIVDNIADCVESSKKVLMVFSKHFVRSQWCQFELNYCLRHVMEHEDALIIVCLDNVTSLDIMTTAMMAVLKTTTYIQWAGQADAVRSFWGRLEIALDEILPAGEHAL